MRLLMITLRIITDNDNNGKRFYKLIDTELRERRKDRNELIEMIVEYLFEKNDNMIKKTTSFLTTQFKNNNF